MLLHLIVGVDFKTLHSFKTLPTLGSINIEPVLATRQHIVMLISIKLKDNPSLTIIVNLKTLFMFACIYINEKMLNAK